MSKIGKKPIQIPESVEVSITEKEVRVKGPKGELSFILSPQIKVSQEDKKIFVSAKKEAKILFGTARAHIANIIKGVSEGFEKVLELHGVGFRAELQGKDLVLSLGFSHPVKVAAPIGIEFKIQRNTISIFGISKEKVGKIAAEIRKIRPPEPYKGKGVRYAGEEVRRKAGKVAGSTESASGK